MAMAMSSSAFFRPNTLFLPILPKKGNSEADLQFLMDRAIENEMGVILHMDNPDTGLGREQVINVWLREQSPEWTIGLRLPNLDLSLLLAYQLARNWGGRINLLTVVADETERHNAEQYLSQLMDLGRMPRGTQPLVFVGGLDELVRQAPEADLNIFGLQRQINLAFMQRMIGQVDTACIFVRDSGRESALV
jgi:hypothetical protein